METRDVVFIALFAAIIAALGVFPPITVPVVAVPITAQSLGIMLAGGILGAVRGGLAVVLLLVLVALGLPLLAGGRGGFGVFLGPAGGYLFGWVAGAVLIGYLTERFWARLNFFVAFVICVVGGILFMYGLGVPWSAFVAEVTLGTALIGSLPFVPGDIVKCLIAAGAILIVKKSYPIIRPRPS